MSYERIIESIISLNVKLAAFWSNSHGWASEDAAQLMSKSRLDRQVELSRALQLWDFKKFKDGQLILAWANLGALIEGTLKLFLAVYYEDYKADGIFLGGKLEQPDSLTLEKLKQFFREKGIVDQEWIVHIELVQQRRNAIHAFKDRPIGDEEEFGQAVALYLELMHIIHGMLPYPD